MPHGLRPPVRGDLDQQVGRIEAEATTRRESEDVHLGDPPRDRLEVGLRDDLPRRARKRDGSASFPEHASPAVEGDGVLGAGAFASPARQGEGEVAGHRPGGVPRAILLRKSHPLQPPVRSVRAVAEGGERRPSVALDPGHAVRAHAKERDLRRGVDTDRALQPGPDLAPAAPVLRVVFEVDDGPLHQRPRFRCAAPGHGGVDDSGFIPGRDVGGEQRRQAAGGGPPRLPLLRARERPVRPPSEDVVEREEAGAGEVGGARRSQQVDDVPRAVAVAEPQGDARRVLLQLPVCLAQGRVDAAEEQAHLRRQLGGIGRRREKLDRPLGLELGLEPGAGERPPQPFDRRHVPEPDQLRVDGAAHGVAGRLLAEPAQVGRDLRAEHAVQAFDGMAGVRPPRPDRPHQQRPGGRKALARDGIEQRRPVGDRVDAAVDEPDRRRRAEIGQLQQDAHPLLLSGGILELARQLEESLLLQPCEKCLLLPRIAPVVWHGRAATGLRPRHGERDDPSTSHPRAQGSFPDHGWPAHGGEARAHRCDLPRVGHTKAFRGTRTCAPAAAERSRRVDPHRRVGLGESSRRTDSPVGESLPSSTAPWTCRR